MHINQETIVNFQAHKSIKKGSKWCFWVAIMVSQMGIWLVIRLKCMENGQWLPVISDSAMSARTYMHARDYVLDHGHTPQTQ